MKLTALRLFNVKRFAGKGVAIEGIGDGVNVLCAANEFGKSTSFEALHALFFASHSSTAGEVRNLRPYSGGNPLIEAEIVTADQSRFRITKQFYNERRATIMDVATGRVIAQADEAENFIAGLISGGAGGPAGLLWVRQGITGIERRSKQEEESDKQVRAGLLESVQGEVEAMTGGRRMAEILAAAMEEAAQLVTPTGKPKANGRYADAIDRRDQLRAEEERLAREVTDLREALDRRAKAQQRLAELDATDERAARRTAVTNAETTFDQARAQHDRLKAAEAGHDLARERRDTADHELKQFREAVTQAERVDEDTQAVERRRDDARERRSKASDDIARAQAEADVAEAEEQTARDLLDRLEAASRAQSASERHEKLAARLKQAEDLRATLEDREAQLAQARLPVGAIDELADLDIEIARIRAVRDAARPSIRIAYDTPDTPSVTLAGSPLNDGEERGYDGNAELAVPGIGAITLHSNRPEEGDTRLDVAEDQRRTLLASMGVADLAAARAQQILAQGLETQAGEARAQLDVLAPEGVAHLRQEVAQALPTAEGGEAVLDADPIQVRADLDAAVLRRSDAGLAQRAAEPLRATAEQAYVTAETELAKLQTREQHVAAILGPVDGRDRRGQDLAAQLEAREAKFADALNKLNNQRTEAVDLDTAEATLRRTRSVEQAADTELQQLREALAALNAQIRARSDEAVEETWRETGEKLSAAEVRVSAFEEEVAVLGRLIRALDNARSDARDLYLTPVMTELRPLLGLMFDDVSITFDERTLLPQTISRAGLEEEVDRLSGGMREQLSILTRLAFARLLARDGRPAPVILDDALVYSDDDRIERMFDALHRQARDQQIIIFSCRQRAFQRLGGNVLQLVDWHP